MVKGLPLKTEFGLIYTGCGRVIEWKISFSQHMFITPKTFFNVFVIFYRSCLCDNKKEIIIIIHYSLSKSYGGSTLPKIKYQSSIRVNCLNRFILLIIVIIIDIAELLVCWTKCLVVFPLSLYSEFKFHEFKFTFPPFGSKK